MEICFNTSRVTERLEFFLPKTRTYFSSLELAGMKESPQMFTIDTSSKVKIQIGAETDFKRKRNKHSATYDICCRYRETSFNITKIRYTDVHYGYLLKVKIQNGAETEHKAALSNPTI